MHLLHIYLGVCLIWTSRLATTQQQLQIPLAHAEHNNIADFIYNFTHFLHRMQQFNSFVIFTTTMATAALHSNSPQTYHPPALAKILANNFDVPIISLGLDYNGIKLRTIMGINNLVYVQLDQIDDPILQVVDSALQGLHYMPMLLILRTRHEEPKLERIYKLFEWCWSRNFPNVALTVQIIRANATPHVVNKAYYYSPFPSIMIFDVTDYELSDFFKEFAKEAITNVYGYHFKTPLFIDPPSVFLTSHHPPAQLEDPTKKEEYHEAITGTAGYLFHEYIHHIHGEIEIQPTDNISFFTYHKRTLLLAANKEIDIGIHPFSAMLALANNTEGSYPIGQTNACIIVPVIPEIPEEEYVLRVFKQDVWQLMALVFVGLFIIEAFLTQGRDLGRAWIITYCTQFFQALPRNVLRDRSSSYRVFFIGVCLYIVTINGIYNAALTSMLSTTLFGDQISSVEDFLDSNLRIMLHEYENAIYFDSGLLPVALARRVLLADELTLVEHRDSLNTSYAYVVTAERWLMLNLRQQLLRKPRFRIASHDLCTVPFFLKFPVQWDSPFANSLTWFFMRTMENGLSLRWGDMAIAQAISMKYIRIENEEPYEFKALNLTHFILVYRLFGFMMGLSVVTFLCELIWWKYGGRVRSKIWEVKWWVGFRRNDLVIQKDFVV